MKRLPTHELHANRVIGLSSDRNNPAVVGPILNADIRRKALRFSDLRAPSSAATLQFIVRVVYGTSQRTNTLYRGEFVIMRNKNPVAYEMAGLSYDTKFDFKQSLDLPYTTEWFSVPPVAAHGQSPKLGTLHPSLVRAVEAGFRAAK